MIAFPPSYDGQLEEECAFKGWLSGVSVRLEDGRSYPLTFVDIPWLAQMMEDQVAAGLAHFAEPNLVVLVNVTRVNVEAAVHALVKERFFDSIHRVSRMAGGAGAR